MNNEPINDTGEIWNLFYILGIIIIVCCLVVKFIKFIS